MNSQLSLSLSVFSRCVLQLIIDVFRRARLSAPCVVFFDEAQTLFNAESQPVGRFFFGFSSAVFLFFASFDLFEKKILQHVAKVRAQVVYEMDQIALHARAHLTSGTVFGCQVSIN